MKPVRDLLLQRHRPVQDRLDALRSEFLSQLAGPPAGGEDRPVETGWRLLWREVFVRARGAWTGLAAAGLIAVGLNLAAPHRAFPALPPAPASPATAAAMAEVIEERTRLLADLFGSPGSATPRASHVPASPQPATPAGPRRSSVDRAHPDRQPA